MEESYSHMRSLLITIPLLAALMLLVYWAIRSVFRLWIRHQVKMAILDRIERKPDLLRSVDVIPEFLDGISSDSGETPPMNVTLTGVILATIGITCSIVYAAIGGGRWAVGAYWGGVACVVLGFIIALFGLMAGYLSRTRIDKPKDS